MGFAIIPPIMPATKVGTNKQPLKESELENGYDFPVRINLTVPPEVRRFDLEIVIKGDQLNTVRYRIECRTAT